MSEKYLLKISRKMSLAMKERNCQNLTSICTSFLILEAAVGKGGPPIVYGQYKTWDRG